MPATNPKELLTHLEDLCKAYRVEFVGDLPHKDWPENHRQTLETAKKLASYSYDAYETNCGAANNEPWKAEVKSTAILLQQMAKRCRDRNESSWRHACEPLILGRLLLEVCCTQCRKRTWRSEIEVSREESSSIATSLRDRQGARQPCRCPRIFRAQDHLEATGLNQIFTFRADEVIHHERELSQALGKTESPDRVYGLRLTRNIDNLLYDAAQKKFQEEGQLVERQVFEILGLDQPVDRSGDRLLFPFLVLEAKSGKSSSDWHRVRMQSAFSIRTLLRTQAKLQNATGKYSQWRAGPLVWFFSNRGEEWRVSTAYTQHIPATSYAFGTTAYRILDVWQGSIETLDGALQLLLLVDFIFDWARDIYRVDILNELRILASGDNDELSVLSVDTDIFSTRYSQPVDPLYNGITIDAEHILTPETLGHYDTDEGAIRYAGLVEMKCSCVLLNQDNLSTFLRSMPSKERKYICRRALSYIQKYAVLLTGQVLDSIEEEWTGKTTRRSTYYHTKMVYLTAISYATFLSPQWNVTQELCLFAISKDCWAGVVTAAKLNKSWGMRDQLHVKTQNAGIVEIVQRSLKKIKGGSITQTLLAAIKRTSLHFKNLEDLVVDEDEDWYWTKEGLLELDSQDDRFFLHRTDPDLRKIVHLIYNSFKARFREPQEAFIRFSRRYAFKDEVKYEENPWFREQPQISDDGCVLVSATSYPKVINRSHSICCAYLTSRATFLREKREIGLVVKRAFESRDFYHTTRNHWVSGRPRIKDEDPYISLVWNLYSDTLYGVLTQGLEFVSYITQLSGESPVAPGSLTEYSNTGLSTYRNFNPWQDVRPTNTDPEYRTFFVLERLFYQLKLLIWAATYCSNIAACKKAEGIACCVSCASNAPALEDEQCTKCFARYFRSANWWKRVLSGRKPFLIKAASNYEIGDRIIALKRSPEKLSNFFLDAIYHNTEVEVLLNFYTLLEEPFRNISELIAQQQKYIAYCRSAYSDKMYMLHRRKSDKIPIDSMDWSFDKENDKDFLHYDGTSSPGNDLVDDDDDDDESTECE